LLYHRSPEDLRRNRVQAIQRFLADYETGRQMDRYQVGALPKLPFPDHGFDLALCSHFLFLYSDHYDYAFHRASIQDMLRVSREVRIIQEFSEQGYRVEVVRVEYELQKGGNQMLRLAHQTA